jgi:hypothetical protein
MLAKVLASLSSSTGQLQTAGKRKFKEDWCKQITWHTFNHSMGVESCEVMSCFPVFQIKILR